MAATKGDTLKHRFGPYSVPRVRRGDRVFCEIRGTVVVGGYSDAPIPWPRVKKGGVHCLVLCGALVRAVRKEALIAVAHHWGVSQTTVWKWRKSLNVPRWNEGSTTLAREWQAGRDDDRLERGRANSRTPEARAKLSETLKARPLPPALMAAAAAAAKRPRSKAWCEARSRLWKERGHRPPPPPWQRAWTAAEDALLGTDRDKTIAMQLGRTPMTVQLRRYLLGIPGRLTAVDGPRMRRLRVERGWDRRELADRAGVDRSYIWCVETGRRRRVDRNIADRLAEALGG